MKPPRRKSKAALEDTTSMPAAILPPVIRSSTLEFEIPGTEFYTLLNGFVTERIGPCPEDRHREINYNMNGETGMVEFKVSDKLKPADAPERPAAEVLPEGTTEGDMALPISPLPFEQMN